MNKILFSTILILSLASCQEKTEQKSEQKIIYNNKVFDQIREQGERLHQDTVLSKHMYDFLIPLNKSMHQLKVQNPDFYRECLLSSSSEEMTKKLKSSDQFQQIAKENNLILKNVKIIDLPK